MISPRYGSVSVLIRLARIWIQCIRKGLDMGFDNQNDLCGAQTCDPTTADHADLRLQANQRLAGYFLELPPQRREDIARTLELLPDDYTRLGRVDLAKSIFLCARTKGCVAALWVEVVRYRSDGAQSEPNPYDVIALLTDDEGKRYGRST